MPSLCSIGSIVTLCDTKNVHPGIRCQLDRPPCIELTDLHPVSAHLANPCICFVSPQYICKEVTALAMIVPVDYTRCTQYASPIMISPRTRNTLHHSRLCRKELTVWIDSFASCPKGVSLYIQPLCRKSKFPLTHSKPQCMLPFLLKWERGKSGTSRT